MSKSQRNWASLTALALIAVAAALLATSLGSAKAAKPSPAETVAGSAQPPVFRPMAPTARGPADETPVEEVPVEETETAPPAPKPKAAPLMRRLGALPDRRHLLLRGAVKKGAVPRNYLALYKLAAKRYKLGSDGWAWLAAVGYIESLHGRTMAPGVRDNERTWWVEVNHVYRRPYCCSGPMQFNIYASSSRYGDRIRRPERRSTWTTYGVDANGDGRRDPHDARDAIFAAARKLSNDGRRRNGIDWQRALLRYNNSMPYVRAVSRARARYLRAAKQQSRAVAANQWAFVEGGATVTPADTKVTKADRDL